MENHNNLNNLNVVITCASQGFGFEIAKKFSELGANILISSRNIDKLKIAKKDALRQAAAKNAAIKTGKALNKTEMQVLLNDLLHCNQKTIDQSGKTITVKLTKQSLERFFQ